MKCGVPKPHSMTQGWLRWSKAPGLRSGPVWVRGFVSHPLHHFPPSRTHLETSGHCSHTRRQNGLTPPCGHGRTRWRCHVAVGTYTGNAGTLRSRLVGGDVPRPRCSHDLDGCLRPTEVVAEATMLGEPRTMPTIGSCRPNKRMSCTSTHLNSEFGGRGCHRLPIEPRRRSGRGQCGGRLGIPKHGNDQRPLHQRLRAHRQHGTPLSLLPVPRQRRVHRRHDVLR